MNATASDAQSGIDGVAFPDVSAVSGWSGSTGGTDTTSPYSSPADYAWTAGATQLGSTTITATNGAGLSAADSLTISADSTAPTGQSASLSAGPWYTTPSVAITLDNGTDSESGIDTPSGLVERSSATLTGGTCGSFGSWSPVTLSGGADTTVTSGNCYRYRYTISDNVGNQSSASSASANAKIDTSAPTVANAAPTELTGTAAQYYDTASETLYFRPDGTGSFTLAATASDAQSDIAHVAFPNLTGVSGWNGTGDTDTTSPYESTTYDWNTGATTPDTRTITATNNAGGTATTTITITADTTAPTGQTADALRRPLVHNAVRPAHPR